MEVARTNRAEKKKLIQEKNAYYNYIKQLRMKDVIGQKKLNSVMQATLILKKLFLYYTQQGRCMYSGEKITSIGDLFTSKYDIDHIILVV